ncbi:Phosphoribosylformylglycinamidine synthase, synthetase subunit [Fulvivirga imtechensis AK7]|uniref:Phosphoribosylformylglycinamidine synthase n=1 Tax=Fulvivirga imtechensis AK7 TaxID=1237149 RepID=L8JUB3_9BACT|nr:phosphoribosylformylglycinamidine synthase [Fulvivirga imtechensis]ELR72365.1 Phosphoribosylformylglycinamidine synthase, synthetase subunit [Fulvivirga imtechensis AK7]
MIKFFLDQTQNTYAVGLSKALETTDIKKLEWLFGNAKLSDQESVAGIFIGPRKEMITPWSTNAVEITQNMGISGITRIERFRKAASPEEKYDPMLEVMYKSLDQELFTINRKPEPVIDIDDIAAYNEKEGLALSQEEIDYLNGVSQKLGRKLTDSEVFGFSQVNSEHCRHKIFNGTFVIDGQEMPSSLFKLIKKTSEENPNFLVSAYKDNVAFIQGPVAEQFAPETQDKPDYFIAKDIDTVISLKAETHNFPTTVEPFNGAATGSGGEIRDRLAGGKGSLPLAGTAVYMTSYSRLEEGRDWERHTQPRKWLYQTPLDILIKASDGASDFGNKFGQPLISGSVLTFEHEEHGKKYGFDKVIMLAGGIGFGKKKDSLKDKPGTHDNIVILGGDNYRIGMGGSAVSSVATGEFGNSIELNAIQRSNPEMQKRVMNAIRAMVESDDNPIISIHDHGAGGHLNCLSELVEETGGTININQLPVGDPTLSDKEIIGNESQERMGLVMNQKDIDTLKKVAERERSPMYVVGEVTGDGHFKVENSRTSKNPVDWDLSHMFGSSPKTILTDTTEQTDFDEITYNTNLLPSYLESVLQLEAVACKDWLTNKVDRSVTGKVAKQQTCGEIQLPLNDVAVMMLDYAGNKGVATSIGHAPVSALADPEAGSRLSIAEALTNMVWAPLTHGLQGVSLSANWMWPAKNKGEDARLYKAVSAVSEFARALGINIPTGKDSLSMAQKYPGGDVVYSPGTVIISAVAEVADVTNVISPDLKKVDGSSLIYIDLSRDEYKLAGSSFAQVINKVGQKAPTVKDAEYFKKAFGTIQELIADGKVLAGHDISAGGMITTLLEMCFPSNNLGLDVDLSEVKEQDIIKVLFSENPGLIIQVEDVKSVLDKLDEKGISALEIGTLLTNRILTIQHADDEYSFDINALRDTWFKTSYLLDVQQSGEELAKKRFDNYKKQPLTYTFPAHFKGKLFQYGISNKRRERTGLRAAIIREKGVNGDREMAWVMHLAGFDVKDVHMTDLISGREDLSDVNFIVFVGGFSNSDVLGSAKGWAGAFLYNEKAKQALDAFYSREDTISLGVCNGCQLMMELGLLYPDMENHPKMHHNASGKFESSFINLNIAENNSVMMRSLAGTRLGVWLAHGEGQFVLPDAETSYNIVSKYAYNEYPGNPNGSGFSTAALCSRDGRHLAIMPHLERSLYPWNWANYPPSRKDDEVSPWMEAFVNARKWVEQRIAARV